jgi:TFIIF-interacting CTD phosphatase-like protein
MESIYTYTRRNKENHRNEVNYNMDWCWTFKNNIIVVDEPLNYTRVKNHRPMEMYTTFENLQVSISLFIYFLKSRLTFFVLVD